MTECRARKALAHGSLKLGAPNSGASLDLRLGPHWRCLLALLLIVLRERCKECNLDAKSTTTLAGLVLFNLSYRKQGGCRLDLKTSEELRQAGSSFDLSDQIDTLSTQIGCSPYQEDKACENDLE